MTRLLDGSIKEKEQQSGITRKEAITEILTNSHLEVDESLLKLLRAAHDGSGMYRSHNNYHKHTPPIPVNQCYSIHLTTPINYHNCVASDVQKAECLTA